MLVEGVAKQRAIVNTYYAIITSCVTSCAFSALMTKGSKLSMVSAKHFLLFVDCACSLYLIIWMIYWKQCFQFCKWYEEVFFQNVKWKAKLLCCTVALIGVIMFVISLNKSLCTVVLFIILKKNFMCMQESGFLSLMA